MNQIADKYFFIINPNAGCGRANKEWHKLSKLIDNEGIEYDIEFTGYNRHAKEIVAQKIKQGYRKFIIFGGDGTLNEVVNGIFKQNYVSPDEIYVGVFSMGTGNDWSKYYELSKGYADSIDRIKRGEVKKQDIGKIVYGDKEPEVTYFANVAGLCYDSVVVNATNKNKMKARNKRSKMRYLKSLLTSLISYKPWKLKIYINNEILEGKFLSISIGLGKYSGGGMIQTPNAIIDDGYFDVTIYPNMSKLKIITNISKLYSGEILGVKGIKNYRVKSLRIEAENSTFAETDGEIIGGAPYEISILPKALNIFV